MPEVPDLTDRLIHIADLHFWHVARNPLVLLNKRMLGNFNVWLRRRHEFAMHRAEAYADHVASLGIEELLLTGDFSSTALDAEFLLARAFVDGLRNRGLHISLMAGNHDVYTFEAVRKRRFERHFAEYLPASGYPWLQRLKGGTPLVLIPTVCPNLVSSRGRITRAEIEQVENLLKPLEGSVIVAGHYPLLTQTYGYTVSRERELRNAETLRQALGRSGKPILYVCGHVHRFSYVQDVRYPNLRHLSSGAFFRIDKTRSINGDFSEIHVDGESLSVFRHTYRDAWKRTAVPIRSSDDPIE